MSIVDIADNSVPTRAWDTVLFEKYCRFRFVMTQGLSNHSDALLDRRPYPAGAHVLDIGCGFGDTTLQLAASVGEARVRSGLDIDGALTPAGATDELIEGECHGTPS